jgi:hypothetical protein
MVCECDDEWIGEDCSTPGVNITLDRSSLLVLENKTSVEFCLLKSRQTSVNITAVVNPTQVLDDLSSGSGQLDRDFDLAEEGRDFESVPQEIQIPSDVIQRCFQLTITDDTILERPEIFHFDVMFMKKSSLLSMGILAMDLNGSVIIDNDDEVTVQFEMASYELLESEEIVMVNITASGQASFPYSLTLTAMDVEAELPSDYNLSSTVTLQAGEESVLLPITIINDDVFEPNETFKVIMTLPDDVIIPGIRVGKNNVTLVRILNDDPVEVSSSLEPSTAIASSSLEPFTTVVSSSLEPFTTVVSSSLEPSTTVVSSSLELSTTVSSSSLEPFTTVVSSSLEPSTTVVSSSLELSTTVSSSSLEPFTTVASSSLDLPTSVMTTVLESSSDVVSSSSVVATLSPTSQPTPPSVLVSFERTQYTTYEGDTVVISLVSNLTTEFDYTVEISLNDVNTTSDSDYYAYSPNVIFYAGKTSANFTVYIVGDGIVERTESFQCTIKAVFSSQDVPILLDSDKSTALVIINDYDYLPLVFAGIFSVGDPYNRIVYTAYENVSTVPLRIVAYGTASFEFKVQLYVAQYIASLPGQENATEFVDFELPKPVVFRPNQTEATVNVTILNDRVLEPIVEAFTVGMQVVGDLTGRIDGSGLVLIEVIDDDGCPKNLVFPRTLIGETRSLPCSSIAGGSGMIGEMRSTCTSEGVWGSVDMSQCTFRKDVPTLPILWLVELNRTNLTQLEDTITNSRIKRSNHEDYNITMISRSVDDDTYVYSVQFSGNALQTLVRERLSVTVRSEVTVIRDAGCNCCASGQVDLYNQYGGVRLCDGDAVSAQVPCSCENDINKCSLRFVKSVNGCRLDTDRDGIADREDPCVGCCVSELNIFDWPKTDHGSSSEANCSQLHPSFGDSKVRRTCRVNDIWDPVDIGSCTFKNTTTRSTPILLFNATVNDNNTDTVRQTLNEQAESLLPNNGSSFNVTEVAFVASSISGQRVVFFVIEFSENTTLEENFITTIKNDTVNLIEAVIPSDNCSCSSNRSNDLRRLCIGTATAPCDCERRGTCKCVDPYIREPGGTCSLDTDGDGEPDYKDICPLEHGTDCGTAPPPAAQSDCPREKDTEWNLLWRQTQRGQTRVQRCPNGITRSAGLASRKCMENGQWGEVDATKCVSRAFQAISENNEDVNRVLDSAVNNDLPLTTEERETVVEVAEELSTALDNTAAENTSVLPGDLTITTQVINGLADLSENNGLFNIENPREQQEVVANVLNRVLDSDNAPAFTATRQNAPAVSILESTEQLARSGFTNQNISFVPPVTDNQTVNQEEIVQENFAIQSNRFNPKSFMQPTFQVSFPKVSLSAFANRNLVPQIVIPGDFLSALLPGPISTTENPLSATEATATNPTTAPGATAGPSSLSENPVDVVSFTMNNLQEHLPLQLADKGDAERIDRFEAGSLIVSSQVTGVDSTAVNTGPTVNLSFSLLQGDDKNVEAGPNEQIEIKCAAWNFTGGPNGTGGWSFDGIEVVSVNDTHVECTSKHLTSFIVLVSVVPLEGPPHPVFNVFTYIGCSISLVCLLISIIFFISLRKELIKRLHNFVHLNLCIALACGLIVFIGGMEHATSIQVACVIVSVLQHYFFLAAFSWMLCEAVMIYVLLVRVFRANDRKWIYLYLSLGWGLPVPIVIVSVAIRHYEYFIADPVSNVIFACWLPVKDGVIAAFIAPMLAILLVNAVLLTISMASLAKSKCGQKQEMKEEKKQGAQTAWQLTKAVLILMPLMGFTWVIGLLAVGPGRDVVAFVFIVLNSLQGLFIFILHVVRHEKVWGKIKARLPTIREGKLTFWTSHSSSATKSTLYSKSRKQSTLSSKHYASTMSGHDPGLMYSETKDKPLDEASIKDGEIEGLVLEVKNGENSGDEPNPGVSATTFGITEPTNGAQETSISTPPPESTTTPDNEQPITLATSFGFVPLTEQGDPLPPDTPQTEPESTFL